MVYQGLPKTRAEAKRLGTVAYFTGKPCKNGHIDKRYTRSKVCYGCKRRDNKKFREEHPERAADIAARSYANNAERHNARCKDYYSKNKEQCLKKQKEWVVNNRDKRNNTQSKWRKKRRSSDPVWRLNKNTCKGIWDSLKKAKSGRHWESLVEFTVEELVAHLETQFKEGMTWDNYGAYWEVDHIKPVSLCSSFEEAWRLSNLQPLPAKENNKKGNRYIG